MATAYHLEALRRQRVIDRTVQAKRRLEEEVSVTRNAYANVALDFSSIVVYVATFPFTLSEETAGGGNRGRSST